MTTAIAIDTKADLKVAILHQLEHGKAHAISGKALAQRLGERNTRSIRLAIQDLIAEGHAIAGTPTPPYGYYITATAAECQECLDDLRSYVIKLCIHRRNFKLAARPLLQPGQLKLKL